MEKLKPCPFCGGKVEVCEGGINGRMRVYGLVEHKDGCFFLADGLPTRYQHIMEGDFNAWNKRTDRTCHMEYNEYWSGDELYPTEAYQCSVCGHITQEGLPDYCPRCGAKVVAQ